MRILLSNYYYYLIIIITIIIINSSLLPVSCQQQRTYNELIKESITLGPTNNRIINHSDLPVVKDALSVTLKISITNHDPNWAAVFHKGNFG